MPSVGCSSAVVAMMWSHRASAGPDRRAPGSAGEAERGGPLEPAALMDRLKRTPRCRIRCT
jgi:hypothetical protein